MEKHKKIIMIGIIVLIVLLVALTIIVILLNNKEDTEEVEGTIRMNKDGTVETLPEPEMNLKYDQKELREPTEFFSVEKCIQDNINQNFEAEKMNYLQGERIMTYSVYGTISSEDSSQTIEKYFIVRVDMYNMTFEIKDLSDGNHENIDQIQLEDDETKISNNNNNSFEYVAVSGEEMCKKYLEDFKLKELSNPQEAYSMLDEEYKQQKFPTFESFQEYINNNKEKIQSAELAKYEVNRKDDYTEYTLVDTNNNSYTVKTTGIWDYTILINN